jgi:pimeloyl-ACP methyl ester carboxylesterase
VSQPPPTLPAVRPDLRGFGWSGQPAVGDFAKERFADDMLALLGIERAGYIGHDWGGWTGWLLALRAPERLTRMLLLSIVHPWAARVATLLNSWRVLYQLPLAATVLGPALVRDGRLVRMALAGAMSDEDIAIFADVLREPARAAASSRLYRHFQLRDLPALLSGRYEDARVALPVKLLFPRRDGAQHESQLRGVERHAPQAEVELVDGGHLLADERPQLVADRARAWFG